MNKIGLLLLAICLQFSCSNKEDEGLQTIDPFQHTKAAFGNNIQPDNLPNYANQLIPAYVNRFNGQNNPITNEGSTLGRVLFYDKNLSSNNTISCASCHQQANAFSDQAIASLGVNGTTARHSMRLVNARFGNEVRFFWDERATNLETQTTMPIRDHGEMGFSGTNGDQPFSALIAKLSQIGYYKELFKLAFGTEEITETKMQLALSQFIRSIQSFDSKYDQGRSQVPNDGAPFPNFTAQENQGKNLFLVPPQFTPGGIRTGGGLGCAGCHAPPTFDINPNSLSNGVSTSILGGNDFSNTRSPSLRDLVKPNKSTNGPMMHDGSKTTLAAAIAHYNNLTTAAMQNPNLDPRLKPGGVGQQLQLTPQEIQAVSAFLETLSGNFIYVDAKWSNPFLN